MTSSPPPRPPWTIIIVQAVSLGHPGEVALKWIEVPLGSVRASLGYMSTFEDVYALAEWVERVYKDRAE